MSRVSARHLYVVVLFARVVALTHACHALSCVLFRVSQCCFVSVAMCRSHTLSRTVRGCRVVSARDNKLFSLINTRVDNVNLSGHIF
jgi:hypothetical protein